jgi:hypothetical protein
VLRCLCVYDLERSCLNFEVLCLLKAKTLEAFADGEHGVGKTGAVEHTDAGEYIG